MVVLSFCPFPFLILLYRLNKLTNGVTFPAATPLTKAGAVHHVAFLMLFGEGLVHLVGQTVHNTLIYSGHKEHK